MKKYILLLSGLVMLMLSANSFAAYVRIQADFSRLQDNPIDISASNGANTTSYTAPILTMLAKPGSTVTLTFHFPEEGLLLPVECDLTFTLDGWGALTALPTIAGSHCNAKISLSRSDSRTFYVNPA